MQYYGKVQYNKLLQWSRNRGGKGGLGPPPPNIDNPILLKMYILQIIS